jgi:type I restriction enzyme, S subunit
MSICATVGLPVITRMPACIHDGFVAFLDLHGIDQKYLYYVLKWLEPEFQAAGQTGSQANLNTDIVKNQVVPFPPPAEQHAIAETLSDMDELLASIERLIAKKRDIKRGVMRQLLTGKIRIAGFVDVWSKKRLGDVTLWLSGGTPNRANLNYWNGNIPWISGSTLKKIAIYESDQHLTPAGVAAGSKMAPLNSTLLLVRGSALHNEIRAGIVLAPVCFNQDVKAVAPRQEVVPKFLTYFILGHSDELLKLVSSAGNSAGVLDTKLLHVFEIALPQPEEQLAIAQALSDMDAEIEALESRLAKTREIKQGMIQELLTGRTRLVSQETAA